MKFRPYPRYKDSGIEWLGKVPEHWNVMPLKWRIRIKSGDGITSVDIASELNEENPIPVIGGNGLMGYNQSINIFSKTLVVGRVGALCGNVHEVSAPAYVTDNALILTIQKNSISIKYLGASLQARNLNEIADKTAQPLITGARVKAEFAPFPPLAEQNSITNFLDRETHRIDALVEEKKRFIELLKEKRQTSIRHAITKGLSPTVKMKDSGIDWLGEVPAHWSIKKVKYLFEIRKRIAGKEGYPVLSITQSGIKVKDTISGEGQLAMDYSKYQFVEVGDFAMNHMDLLTGYVDISNFHGVTSPDYRVFALTDANSVDRYFLYLMQMGYKDKIFYSYGQGVANIGRWRFQTEPFNNFSVPYPNKDEQQQIVDFLDAETSKIDALLQETQVSIELLKEHRTALISAAVTGKIDVREAA